MTFLLTIWTVALYEIKTLARSWFFRIFSLIAFGILLLLNTAFFASQRASMWTLRGIPSLIPYMNIMLLNVVQAVIGIFMASDFLKYDKKLDSTEVIYTRSMTNAEYVLGKSLGVFFVFISLNLLVLLLAMVFNVFFADVPVVPISYLYYPLFISIPTLTFIFGLSFVCMVLFRSQAVTFIILLGYIAGTIFFLGNTYHYLFDYMAFNVPLVYSDFVGFGDINSILIHRGIYFFLGLGFIFTTILLLKRLPQSPIITRFSFLLTVLFIGTGIWLGKTYLSNISTATELRAQMTELNRKLADEPYVSIQACNLDLTHQGNEIEVTADIVFENTTSSPIQQYLFSLNPGLIIERVIRGGSNLSFNRDLHILSVPPSTALVPGETDSLSIHYRGTINEEACYVTIEEEREDKYGLFVYNFDKRYSFITPLYVLLTHENLWYPISGIPYGSVYPLTKEKDFTDFNLRVATDPALTACSQGSIIKADNGEFIFTSDLPLPQISLAIGQYEKRSITVDDIDYNLFLMEGHDYFSHLFPDFSETLSEIISETKEDLERKLDMQYPYKQLSLIEVPIQFYGYAQSWSLHHETVQPEQVFLPEKGLLISDADFRRTEYFMSHGGRGGRGGQGPTMTPEEMKSNMVRRFIQSTLIDASMERGMMNVRRTMGGGGFSIQSIIMSLLPGAMPGYNITPNYHSFTNHFSSDKWPIFNIAVEHYLQSLFADDNFRGGFMSMMMGVSAEELANIELTKQNLAEIIADPEKTDMIYDVLDIKSDYLFSVIKAEIGNETLDNFLISFLKDNRFKDTQASDFIDALHEQFDFDLEPQFDQWYTEKQLPAFVVTGVNSTEVIDEESTLYQVAFNVYNPEPVDGIFSVTFVSGGGGPPGRGGGFNMFGGQQTAPEEYIFNLKGNEAKEFSIVLDQRPVTMQVNTFTSLNLPATIEIRFETPRIDEDAVIFEGTRVLDQPPAFANPGEIIVDNEDPGFEITTRQEASFLKRMLFSNRTTEEDYTGLNFFHPPVKWQSAVISGFYGIYRHSASYKKSGSGDQTVSWNARIPDSGRYDIYYYTADLGQMGRMNRGRGRRGGMQPFGEQEFRISHDDGVDEISIDTTETEGGWTFLGTYYLSQGAAKVEMSDKSNGNLVYADAVKWVKK